MFLRIARKPIRIALFLSFLFAAASHAQGPVFAGAGPVVEASLGYSSTNAEIPSQHRLGLNGLDTSLNADFSRRFGVKLEASYERASDVYGTGRHADILNYFAGPVFYPVRHRSYNLYTQLLLGAARQTGVNITPDGEVLHGFVNKYAWTGGAGFQYSLTPSLSLRAGLDYIHASFFNSSAIIQGQSNYRSVVSVVYTFGEGNESRH